MPVTANALPGYYTTKEAAERLGYARSDTLRQYCAAGRVPDALKVGKTWLIPVKWVDLQEKEGVVGQGARGKNRE